MNCPHCGKPINAAAMLGSISTPAKAKAARENGSARHGGGTCGSATMRRANDFMNTNTDNAATRSLHPLVGWLNRRSNRKLKERLVELEAHEKVWALTVEAVETTNSYFIGRLAGIRGEIAVVRERIARTEPPNDKLRDGATERRPSSPET